MSQFFGSIYCLLEDFFTLDLANYMWGTSSYSGQEHFIGIGLIMFGVSLFIMALYYYIVNKPKFNHWYVWLIFGAIGMIANFIAGWQWTVADLYAGDMIDPNEEPLPISEEACLCFGVANAIFSLLFYFAFSMMFKWWSTNCKQAPFVS